MGCATSKQQPICRNCHAPCSPVRRSYSFQARHPPRHNSTDSYHLVSLTSSTLGSLVLDPSESNSKENDLDKVSKDDFEVGVVEAKSWSKMIEEKIPKVGSKTPARMSSGEPETINAWELMEGLDDTSPLQPPKHRHARSFSFHHVPSSSSSFGNQFCLENESEHLSKLEEGGDSDSNEISKLEENVDSDSNEKSELEENVISSTNETSKYQENADSDSNETSKLEDTLDSDSDGISTLEENVYSDSNEPSIASEFDPEVIESFRKALEELPPTNPFYLKSLENDEKQQALDGNDDSLDTKLEIFQPRAKEKLVLYFTSLRGVRKTYEECCHVRMVLKSIGIRVDERDVSMHSGFKEELKDLLGEGFKGSGLPKVFVGRKYIGGAEEIRKMHEEGQLEKELEGCEMVEDGGKCGGGDGGDCEACGDIRFIPCETCSGSCKIYYEEENEEDDEADYEADYGFQRCPDCNENGLIRCPICCE